MSKVSFTVKTLSRAQIIADAIGRTNPVAGQSYLAGYWRRRQAEQAAVDVGRR